MMKLAEVCKEIGCSGMDAKCPGNRDCSIIRKICGFTNHEEDTNRERTGNRDE